MLQNKNDLIHVHGRIKSFYTHITNRMILQLDVGVLDIEKD